MASSFGANLRAARVAAGLTQEQVAVRLDFKRTTAISLWERAETHVPEPETILKLAAAIGCPPATLLENVITPYDAIRGYTRTLSLDQARALFAVAALDNDDREILELTRRMPRVQRSLYLSLLKEQSRAWPQRGPDWAADGRFQTRARRPRGRAAHTPETSDESAPVPPPRARRSRKRRD